MEQSKNFSQFWHKRVFAVVTGASRGIGRTLVEKLAELISSESILLLISRDETSMLAIKKLIGKNYPSIRVHIGVADLSACDEKILDEILSTSLIGRSHKSFDHAICVHNAGSLGDASKRCVDLSELGSCLEYFQLNVASAIILNSLFLHRMELVERKTVVNISSLCGIEAFASLALYCTGKAARDMFFKVLAKEEPSVRVLNYAPGPVETSMRNQLLDQSWDNTVKLGDALTTDMTCNRLLRMLADDSYISGAHVDYFDS